MLTFSHPLHEKELVNSFWRKHLVILLEIEVKWDIVFFGEQLINALVTDNVTCTIVVVPCFLALMQAKEIPMGKELQELPNNATSHS